MPINRKEMQAIARKYHEPIALVTGSDSGVEAAKALKHYGLRTIIYVSKKKAPDYIKKLNCNRKQDKDLRPNNHLVVADDLAEIKKKDSWETAVFRLNAYPEITKHVDELLALECIQIPSKAFSILIGGDEKCNIIENQFAIPIMGSRKLFKIANIGATEKDCRWFAQKVGIPCVEFYEFKLSENGIRFTQPVNEPLVLLAGYAVASEKKTIIGENSGDLEERVSKEVLAGNIDKTILERAWAQQFLLGADVNLNFFFSPIDAKKEWGTADDMFASLYNTSLEDARVCLANELVSIEERKADILERIKDLPIQFQTQVKGFVKTFRLPKITLNFSEDFLFEDLLKHDDQLLLLLREEEPPGIIGSWSLQATMLQKGVSSYELKLTGMNLGLYDRLDAETICPLIDLAKRKRQTEMTLGERTALELYRSKKQDALSEIVT